METNLTVTESGRPVPLIEKVWTAEGVPEVVEKPVRLVGVTVRVGEITAEATWAAKIAKRMRTAASERGRKRKTEDGLRVMTDG